MVNNHEFKFLSQLYLRYKKNQLSVKFLTCSYELLFNGRYSANLSNLVIQLVYKTQNWDSYGLVADSS